MKKKLRITLSLVFFVMSNLLVSQNKLGQITYIGSLSKKYIDSAMIDIRTKKEWSMSLKQTYADFIKNAKDVELILKIKNDESYYYGVKNLEIEEGNYNLTEGKITITPYYTNNSTNKIIQISEHIGNISYKPLKWEITKKVKKIGKYTCYQAIAIEKLYSRKGYFYNKKVIAWFCPEIPLNFGPKYYKGLPGLILEIHRNEYSITATKVNLNPKKLEFKVPELKNIIPIEESYKRYQKIIDERKKADYNSRK